MNYTYSEVLKEYTPSMYPSKENKKDWSIPEEIQSDFSRLNAILEGKYGREFLKICSFYNKMFPNLKTSNWSRASYNVPPFTYKDQERSDTGTGISTNYLKQIIDQITSRLGTITFEPKLIQEDASLEYICFKDEAERILRKRFRNVKFNQTQTEVFHDAAILGYSHEFIDPYTGQLTKANDWEIGLYEAQFNKGIIHQMLYRDYAFPTSLVAPYLVDQSDEIVSEVTEHLSNKASCDFKIYIDAIKHKSWVVIGGITLEPSDYPYDRVLIETFQWDSGFTKVTTTSLFDLLYPIQREINKVQAKIQQLIRLYKGSVPVFNSDVDLSVKSISNGSGECLYVDSTRPVDSLMTVINPTPLDPELSAQITAHKAEMYELAGIQQMSFDMENMRSAAAVVALDQTRDSTFQAQLQGLAAFDRSVMIMYLEYLSKKDKDNTDNTDWESLYNLVKDCYVDLKPVHQNDPLGNEDATPDATTPDYVQLTTARTVLAIVKGNLTYSDLPYWIDKAQLNIIVATYLVKFSALGIPIPDTMHTYLVHAFIDAIKTKQVTL